MSDRKHEILRKIIQNGSMTQTALAADFNITNRRLVYDIEQLNEDLANHHLPSIEFKRGIFYSSPEQDQLLKVNRKLNEIIFSPEERVCVLQIMLLTSDDDIFLKTIEIDLKISKNTALGDLKRLKDYLSKDELTVRFERKYGYQIYGDEWSQRVKLMQAISMIYKHYGEQITTELLGKWHSYLDITRSKIQSVESYLDIKYTDEDYYFLIYFISAILVRVKRGSLINGDRFDDQPDIEQTREYQALYIGNDEFTQLPKQEKAYVALNLLSAGVRSRSELNDELSIRLSNALWEFLTEFEAKAMLVLPDKKRLLIKLVDHFIPAYYRIKYHIPSNNVLYNKIKSKYEALHDFVRQSVSPINKFFGTEISDEEVAYITLFIGGHLVDNHQPSVGQKIIKVVVLCPNGVSISHILAESLKKTFPEFMFYPPSSIREYSNFIMPHDIVFSTVPVESGKKVYVVNEILSKTDQINLREQVLQDVFKVNFKGFSADGLISVIRKYASIKNEKKLKDALNGLLISDARVRSAETANKNGLIEQLDTGLISLRKVGAWMDVLNQACEMLVHRGIVDKQYRDALLREYHDQPNYVVLNQNIILPHLDPDIYTQKLGVSLVIVRNGTTYSSRRVKIVVLLATPDKASHLNILYDINQIAQNNQFVKDLANLEQPEEVLQALTNFLEPK
ncbi:BglG family transcription antiterminator [Lactiplantibacillus plantarum]|uniref:BglG family transcription antiterminator n=1 Tax=Lactiplantibacillus plantarum TaxID=1590 RepID=UPI00209EAAF2|nr:BglG family transcription antiterminator [Lactiplantibacillus plantarum]USZ60686.1 BglG family transcription antiterminator [Lactiplantibacillus plantarum]